MAIAVDQRHGLKPAIPNRRCRLRSLPYPDMNLLLDLDHSKPAPPPSAAAFHRSFSSPCCTAAATVDEAFSHLPRLEIVAGGGARGLHALVVEAAITMASGVQPVPISGGHGGAFRLSNRSGANFAVLKPIMEDQSTKAYLLGRSSSRQSSLHGGGGPGIREVAAFLLDHGGFSGVPPTALVKILSPINSPPWKAASIQRFVQHEFDAGDLGPSRFSVSSVHRIGILDVRLLNIDRHAGNILVNMTTAGAGAGDCELVPIDHGLCLPEQLDDPYFEWLYWPQSAVPFSEQELEYISSLDPFRDAELLRSDLPMLPEESIRVLILCTIFLKSAAAAGLCLAEVGDMMTREFCGMEEGPSQLESICRQAGAMVGRNPEELDEVAGDFQFNIEITGGGGEVEQPAAVDLPPLLQRKPPKVPKKKATIPTATRGGSFLPRPAPALADDDGEGSGEPQAVVAPAPLTKSISFCGVSRIPQEGGYVSFKGTTEEEWRRFLAAFEELLPAAMEGRRKLQQQQPRMGASCSF